jgi:hypothetical protein
VNNWPPEGNAFNGTESTDDFFGHGSHVLGTMAAGYGPWQGEEDPTFVVGTAGPVQVDVCNGFDATKDDVGTDLFVVGTSLITNQVACLAALRPSGGTRAVVNLSLGAPLPVPAADGTCTGTCPAGQLWAEGIKEHVCDQGGVLVAAAGNNAQPVDANTGGAFFPAGLAIPSIAALYNMTPSCVIGVASIDGTGRLSSFSNYYNGGPGSAPILAAPGGFAPERNPFGVTSSFPSNAFGANGNFLSSEVWATANLAGTSMASPLVAGAVLLLRNAFPSLSPQAIINCIVTTATTPAQPPTNDANRRLPYGILDMQAAYLCASGAAPKPPPVASPPPRSPSPPPPRPSPVVPGRSPPPPPGGTGGVCPPLGGWPQGPCRLPGEPKTPPASLLHSLAHTALRVLHVHPCWYDAVMPPDTWPAIFSQGPTRALRPPVDPFM